jgi:hypothetical protein
METPNVSEEQITRDIQFLGKLNQAINYMKLSQIIKCILE